MQKFNSTLIIPPELHFAAHKKMQSLQVPVGSYRFNLSDNTLRTDDGRMISLGTLQAQGNYYKAAKDMTGTNGFSSPDSTTPGLRPQN